MSENRKGVVIHPTAIVDPKAEIGSGTSIGPYSIIGEHTTLGNNCDIQEHVVIRNRVQLGDEVQVYPNSVLGGVPQHTQYKGEPTRVEVGHRCVLREGVTIHLGTAFGNEVTRVEEDVLLMAYAHVAHDCIVGRGTIVANAVQMAGHATIEPFAILGGHSAVAQHCRIGRYCYIGGGSIMRQDVLPFMSGKGCDFQVQGVNAVGLKRRDFGKETILRLKNIYKIFYKQNRTVADAVLAIGDQLGDTDEVKVVTEFIKGTKMGFIR